MHWNDTFESTIFINKDELLMVSARLPRLYDILTTTGMTQEISAMKSMFNEAVVMAATLLVVLPVLIIYFLIQEWENKKIGGSVPPIKTTKVGFSYIVALVMTELRFAIEWERHYLILTTQAR